MKIALFCCHAEHLKLGALSVASAKQQMPDVEVVHLTDTGTAPLPGADTVLRLDTEGNFWKRYWSAAAALDGEVLLAGTDTLFRRDASDVFAQPFDVALPHIADKKWRYDAGTIFSRTPELFQRLLESRLTELTNSELFRDGVSRFLAEYHRQVKALSGNVQELPGNIYSYVPRAADDPGIQSAVIVHYRGARKEWMLPIWKHPVEEGRWN